MRDASFSLIAGGAGNLAQLAVDAKAHAVVVFVGLEVKVGCAHVERIDQHLLQELDDGSVFHIVLAHVLRIRRLLHRDVAEFKVTTGDDGVERLCRTLRHLFDEAAQLVVLRDDPVHAHLGGELDLLRGFVIGWVRCCNDETISALVQHGHTIGLADLRIQKIAGDAYRIERIHVDQRRAEDAGDSVGEIRRRDGAAVDQLCNECAACTLRLLYQFFRGILVELAGGHQCPGQSGQNNGSRAFGGSVYSGHVCNEEVSGRVTILSSLIGCRVYSARECGCQAAPGCRAASLHLCFW